MGTTKALDPLVGERLAEMGMIRSAGGVSLSSFSSLKNVAVRVVLKGAVYISLMMLPKSKMIFEGSFQILK